MGLFDKKFCDICGEKIGLLGNRKLADGNLRKSCAAKLSPWFTERKQSTVAEIGEQPQQRAANQEQLSTFRPTRTIGDKQKVYIDEANGRFIVTAAQDIIRDNPDIIGLRLLPCLPVTACGPARAAVCAAPVNSAKAAAAADRFSAGGTIESKKKNGGSRPAVFVP